MLSVMLTAALLTGAPPLIVIDPGHGGEHEGAVGACGAREKDVVLEIGTRLAAILDASGRVRTMLTRSSDETVELQQRAELANQAGAALFVSIHANSAATPASHGIETFFLSRNGSDRRLRQLVQRENEGQSPESVRPRSTVEQILANMTLSATHHESQRLAARVQALLPGRANTRDRGVLQAPFIVLMGARMASVLVEVGFLTNPEECALLAQAEHQGLLARSLAAALLAHVAGESTLAAAH